MDNVIINRRLDTHFSIRNACSVKYSLVEYTVHHDGLIGDNLGIFDVQEQLSPCDYAFVDDILQVLPEVSRIVELGLHNFIDPFSCLVKCFKLEEFDCDIYNIFIFVFLLITFV